MQIQSLVVLLIASIGTLANAENCADFHPDATLARLESKLEAANVAFALDPESGIGMNLSDAQVEEFNTLFESASDRVSDDLLVGVAAASQPGFLAKRRLNKSRAELERALEVYPLSWPAHWILGKIHQRLGSHQAALEHFRAAFDINPTQPDVAREAGLEATECRDFEAAVCFYEAALRATPADGGLHSNLAIAQLLAQSVPAALESARRGVELGPDDPVSRRVLDLVLAVQAGERAIPTRVEDLE